MNFPRARLIGGLLAAATPFTLGPVLAAATATQAERTVYVNILGPQGPVVSGVSASDLRVLEDHVEREIIDVEPAREPVSVALLLDTTPDASDVMLDLRRAANDLAEALFRMSPRSRMAIAEFGAQALITQPFTSSIEEIQATIPKIVAHTDGSAVMLEGLVEVARELASEESQRRFIVAVNMEPAQEYSQIRFENVAEAVRDAGATVYAIEIQDGQQRDPGRDQLLEALVSNTGGIRRSINSPSALQGLLGSIASLTTTQFAVTYTRPEGGPPVQMTRVQATREGLRALNNMWSTK